MSHSRSYVLASYEAARQKCIDLYNDGNSFGEPEYIYPNQKSDAVKITEIFRSNSDVRAVSVIKRTKVGMDGLMIELMKMMSTDPDEKFCLS